MPAIANTKYRIQCIIDYEFYDHTFDTIKDLLKFYRFSLGLTRGKVATIMGRKTIYNKYPHIIITKVLNTT